jgi:hypothetical protein
MAKPREIVSLSGNSAPLLLAAAVGLLALPSAVLAFSSRFDDAPVERGVEVEDVTVGRIDPRLARSISVRALARGEMFRFTPATLPTGAGREITVAVLSSSMARSILVRAPTPGVEPDPAPPELQIAPMAYNLGVARGYKGFAPSSVNRTYRPIGLPDLGGYDIKGSAPADSRFAPRIELDDQARTGRAPRTFEEGQQTVDLGGSYRVGRNINVTAGVRYSQDRDRLPAEERQQDGQAVYVGTQFRF